MVDSRIAVIGGGSFATALVKILNEQEYKIGWWMRNKEAIRHIERHGHNPRYLSGADLLVDRIELSSDLSYIIQNYDLIILAVPSAFLKETFKDLDPKAFENKFVATGIKGIIPGDNVVVGEYLHNAWNVDWERIAVISGPCHAEEVAMERLSYLTVASMEDELRSYIADRFTCDYINISLSDDIIGTEYAAVMKNIVAIASGICHAIGYGDNFQAVLVANALGEMKRFIKALYPIKRDITESAYLGDLLVTAYSSFSRNRTFGHMVGKGYTIRSIMFEMGMVAEGYYAVSNIQEMKKLHDVSMPISSAVYKILYNGKNPRKVMAKLAAKLS
jgi:glycerol-3-phosphate dehydrogenase (NAD(P)+)